MDDDEPEPRLRIFLTENSCLTEEAIDMPLLEKACEHLLELVNFDGQWSVGVHLCGESEMSQLHDQYMGDPSPTDVMSFEADEEDEGYLGDVIACVDVAKEESAEHDHDERVELQFYVVHGVLHLLGYDDHTTEDRAEMHRLQKEALRSVGIVVDS